VTENAGSLRSIHLLLDEATSALDSKTEARVMERLMTDFSGDRTMVIVAHRISTLKDTDRVIVFEKGQISEELKYEQLLILKPRLISASPSMVRINFR